MEGRHTMREKTDMKRHVLDAVARASLFLCGDMVVFLTVVSLADVDQWGMF